MTSAIQFVELCHSEAEAADLLLHCATQVDFLGGRSYWNQKEHGWSLQCFFQDNPAAPAALLPDGCRRVLIPRGQRAALGLPLDLTATFDHPQ